MKDLFRFLESKDLVRAGQVRRGTVERLSKSEILEIAEGLVNLTKPGPPAPQGSALAHCASLSLGADRSECAWVECRRSRLERLARFALMYSDRVYVRSFFCDYEHAEDMDPGAVRRDFFDDLELTLSIRAFLERGYLIFLGGGEHLCPRCLAAGLGAPESCASALRRALNELAAEYLKKTSYSVMLVPGEVAVHASGPQYYYDHGGQVWLPGSLPEPIRCKPRLVARLMAQGRLDLSATVAQKLAYHKRAAWQVLRTVTYEAFANLCAGTSLLTDKEIHLSFIARLSQDPELERRNLMAVRHLTSVVPFAADVDLKRLMKLRDREEESFMRFRAALNRAIDAFRVSKRPFTEKEARLLHADVIAPELARLDLSVRNAKKDLVSSALRSVAATVGTISFGLYSGLVPANLAAFAKATGLVKLTSDIIQKALALGDGEKAIREQELYFLWKVRRAARRAPGPRGIR